MQRGAMFFMNGNDFYLELEKREKTYYNHTIFTGVLTLTKSIVYNEVHDRYILDVSKPHSWR